MSRYRRLEARIEQLEATATELHAELSNRSPVSEVERLNLAFDELAQRAPISEVERLNLAFQEIARRAPDSEVERLNSAFDLIGACISRLEGLEREVRDGRALSHSEIERLSLAFSEIAQLHRLLSERAVEIPWVLANYRGEQRVLEVGYAFAEDRYVTTLKELRIPMLVGLDLSPASDDRLGVFLAVQADVRTPVFRDDFFDLILMISTIEHVGRDNSGYGLGGSDGTDRPDIAAIQQLARWLRPGGRLLLSVPFGRFEDHGWLINYDAAYLDSLIEGSQLQIASDEYWEHRGGWIECARDDVRHRGYQSLGAPNAGAVALVELVKPAGQQAHSSSLAGGES